MCIRDSIHTAPLASFSAAADFALKTLARLAVPFFFTATGFFLLGELVRPGLRPRTLSPGVRRFLKKTGVLYALSLIHICFTHTVPFSQRQAGGHVDARGLQRIFFRIIKKAMGQLNLIHLSHGCLLYTSYVGWPHAGLMAQRGVTLEEYIGALGAYTPEQPLHAEAGGRGFDIFRVPLGPEGARFDAPRDRVWQASADNCGGLVVTVWGAV